LEGYTKADGIVTAVETGNEGIESSLRRGTAIAMDRLNTLSVVPFQTVNGQGYLDAAGMRDLDVNGY